MTAGGHTIRARAAHGGQVPLEVITEPARLALHREDAAHCPGGHASALVVPRDERQVADAILSSSSVLVVGAQSSLTGGATPRGDVVLSTARLRAVELAGTHLRVGAGMTIGEVDEWLRPHAAMYPPGPTWTGATVGGTIATNAAGAATFKYGTTRAWVDALTVVLASGEVLEVERGRTFAHPDGYFEIECAAGAVHVPVPRYRLPAVAKVSAGYFAAPGMDLIDLFIGAEGTLGVITEASLRVRLQRPPICRALIVSRDRHAALSLVAGLREEARQTWATPSADRLDVSAIEHMDRRSLALLREDAVDRRLGIPLDDRAEIALLVTIELPDSSTTNAVARLATLLEEHGVSDDAIVAEPGDEASQRRLLAFREAVPLAVNQRIRVAQREVDQRIDKTAADVIVPFERFEEMLDACEAEARTRQLDLAVWGHISDGNVHPNIIPKRFADVESGREALLAFGRQAIRMGGSPLAEHGVGRSRIKQQLVCELYGQDGIEQMRAVKRALDPDGKLAPGVLFDSAAL